VIAALYDAAFQLPLTNFQDFVLAEIGKLLPFDSAVWATGINTTNQIHAVHLVNQAPDLMMRYAPAFVETDLVRARAIAEPGVAFRIEDVMSIDHYRSLPVYIEMGQDAGIEYSMGTAQNDPISGLSELILLWRADRDRPFTDAEREVKQLLVPHMVAAWRHRQLIGLVKQSASLDDTANHDGRAHSIVDATGMIYAVVGNFGAQLSDAAPGWIGPYLPDAIIKGLESDAATIHFGGHEVRFTRAGDRHIVTLTPQPDPVSLTAAELRTAELFAAGASYRDIAAKLDRSTYTVRNQISAAYRKLGVHTKLGLADAIRDRT
jgi:DNA-binding CsgD family transcriptional regulator